MRFLIDIDSLKKLSLVNANVEVSKIRPLLKRSQDMYIEPVLGSDFYNHLLDAVENSTLTANELTLIQEYIAIVLSIACEIRMTDAVTEEIRNIGTGNATDPNFQSSTVNNRERDKGMSYKDLTFYKNRLKRYLCENEALFPLYNSSNINGIVPEKKETSSFGDFFINSGKKVNNGCFD